jgi:hypothetical protein
MCRDVTVTVPEQHLPGSHRDTRGPQSANEGVFQVVHADLR